MERKDLLTKLLNLNCRDSKEVIEIDETVALFDWGLNTSDNIIGYGKYTWDKQSRSIDLEIDRSLSKILMDDFRDCEVDRYDLFRTSPRKLTEEEKKYL